MRSGQCKPLPGVPSAAKSAAVAAAQPHSVLISATMHVPATSANCAVVLTIAASAQILSLQSSGQKELPFFTISMQPPKISLDQGLTRVLCRLNLTIFGKPFGGFGDENSSG